MTYKSALRIPCYNEGKQGAQYRCPTQQRLIHRTASNIFCTLQILQPWIQKGVRDSIIIQDDGSDDDTLARIRKFKQDGKYGKEFVILSDNQNKGKLARFLEALRYTKQSGIDNLMMTDADMVYMPAHIISRLTSNTKRDYEHGYSMVYSEQGEYTSHRSEYTTTHEHYTTYGKKTSGTRSVQVTTTHSALNTMDVQEEVQEVGGLRSLYGYGLEKVLNIAHVKTTNAMCVNADEYDLRLSGKPMSHTIQPQNIPLFLRAMRKDPQQHEKIKTLDGVLNPYLHRLYHAEQQQTAQAS
ncbi:MAG: glycosyltransferase [Candidatus Absconditabacterales bacterium]